MLSFSQPGWLMLLVLAPLLLRRSRQPSLLLPRVSWFAGMPRGRAKFVDWGGRLIRVLIVALLALAAAGPRVPDLRTRLPANGIALALVLDVSGSMATPDFSGLSRLAAAKEAFDSFIDRRADDAITLIPFAAVPYVECPPTLNHSVVKKLINRLEPRGGVDAGTNIGDALAEALSRLQRATALKKAIILLSDGEHNATGTGAEAPLTPRQAAQLAANLNVPLYAIDCGGDPSGEQAEQRRAGQAILQSCSALTGGRYFAANNPEQLSAAMREIDELERTTVESFQYRRYHDLGIWCGAAAAILWLGLTLLEATLWRVLP